MSVSRDKTVKLWDVQTGKFLRTVSGERNQILTLALSGDGGILATGSVAPEINLMVYPIKVLLAEEEPRAEQTAAQPVEEPEDLREEDPKPALDLTALADTSAEDVEALAYKVIKSEDPRAGLEDLERKLDERMREGKFCRNSKEVAKLAHQILLLAPYDKAAYHALVVTGIVNQDLKMIFLMSLLGGKALFFSQIYSYEFPQVVDAKLEFWRREVFNAARERAGRELELEFVGCDGNARLVTMPAELRSLDIPQEALRIIASKRVRVNFRQFEKLDSAAFVARVFALVDQAMELRGRPTNSEAPFTLSLQDAPARPGGLMNLDLSVVDVFGDPGRIPFQLRRARGEWLSFYTDKDRKKSLLLPAGDYYLRVKKKVLKAFTIRPPAARQVVVDALR